jgi:hypothetical protein
MRMYLFTVYDGNEVRARTLFQDPVLALVSVDMSFAGVGYNLDLVEVSKPGLGFTVTDTDGVIMADCEWFDVETSGINFNE